MLTYTTVTESNLAELWPLARYYFIKVCARNGVAALPEDVYAHMRSDKCSVLILRWNDEVVGAAAVRKCPRDDERQDIYVWALGTEPVLPAAFFQAFSDEMVQQAVDLDCVSVSMASRRAGWGRFIKRFGWKPTYTTYEIEVPHGQEKRA